MLDAASEKVPARGRGLEAFTPHDLRRTAATLAQQEGIGFEAVSALLNHTNPSVTAVYARHDFMREKREAVEAIERAVLRLAIRHEASAN